MVLKRPGAVGGNSEGGKAALMRRSPQCQDVWKKDLAECGITPCSGWKLAIEANWAFGGALQAPPRSSGF